MQQDPIISSITQFAQNDVRLDVLWLYGSRAAGTARSDSDYDFAVAFTTPLSDALEQRLQSELLAFEWADALNLPEQLISVADINLAPIPLALNIVQQGQVLCVKNGLRLAQEENRVTSMWEIDHQYHVKHYG